MNQPIQVAVGDHIFLQHGHAAIRAEVTGFEVCATIRSRPVIEYTQPNRPVFLWRVQAKLLEDASEVWKEGNTLYLFQKDVIAKAP